MKKTLKKILICILIILIINNFLIYDCSFAATAQTQADSAIGKFLGDLLESVIGLLTYPYRIIALTVGYAVDSLTAGIAYSQGTADAKGTIKPKLSQNQITPFDILFNHVALVDVNFFNITNQDTVIMNIRKSVAQWFYVMRTIASAILLCILIYVGIRMAISTVASDKASYKKMLVDWVTSLALIFLIQYIMVFTLQVNSVLVQALEKIGEDTDVLNDAILNIKTLAGQLFDVNSIAATIVYCMLVIQTIALLISYINRMLKIAFLVIISPLITLTYSIDKMGDGKAQALGMWLKEFIYTVLLQPFHCIIYLAFVSMALTLLTNTTNDDKQLAAAILSMLCIKFTKDGEKILGKIFNFSDHTSDSSIGVGMAASAMLVSKAKGIGKGTRTAFNSARNIKGKVTNLSKDAKVEALAARSVIAGAMRGKKKSFAEAKEEANVAVTEKEAKKIEDSNAKRSHGRQATYKANKKISEQTKEIQDEIKAYTDAGMSASLAAATVRKKYAIQDRTAKKQDRRNNFAEKHKILSKPGRTIRGVRSTASAIKNIAGQSEVLKSLSNAGKSVASGGVALFAGSATYGATGNAFNSFGAAFATYRGTNEFLKTSVGTVKNEGQQIAKGLGCKNKYEVEQEVNMTRAMAPILSDNTELQKHLNDLYSSLDSALSGLSAAEANNVKNNIKNTVAKELKENPTITNDQLMDKISSKFGSYGITNDVLEHSNFNDAVQTQRRKNLYDNMQTASDMGIDENVYTKMLTKGFDNDYSSSSNLETNTEVINDVTAKDSPDMPEVISDDKVDELSEKRSHDGLESLYDDMRHELIKIESKLEKGGLSPLEEAVLNSQRKALLESEQKIYDQMIDKKLQEFEQELEEIKNSVGADASAVKNIIADAKIGSLRGEFQAYLDKNINKGAGDRNTDNIERIHDKGKELFQDKWKKDTVTYKNFKEKHGI